MKHVCIALLLGTISSFAMAPYNFPPSLFIGLSGLYILLEKQPKAIKATIVGFAFSFGYFTPGLMWIGNALLVEGNPYWWAWPLAVAGLPFILSLFTACGCFIYHRACQDRSNALSFAYFTLILFLVECARGLLFTGFPWNQYGYTWISVMQIAQVASLYNIYLLTFLTIFWSGATGYILITQDKRIIKTCVLLIAITSIALSYGYGHYRIGTSLKNSDENKVAIVIQPNIKQSEKWKIENRAENFLKLIELSKYKGSSEQKNEKKTYNIIWPETAISQDLINSPWVSQTIAKLLDSYPGTATLITGALRYNQDNKTYHNSVITYNNKGEITQTYDKSHLVPFGEYMPLESIIDIAPIVGFSGFAHGKGSQTISLPQQTSALPLICYEIIFPEEIQTKGVDILINVTNDAWYGDSAGPRQHLVQAQFRAIETRTPILRSANTGISAIINPLGYIVKSAQMNTEERLEEKLPISFAKLF